MRLGVDPRKAEQMIRGTVALPSGTGKDVRVAVFAAGDAAAEARAAGADIVGADDLAAQVEGGMLDFDVAIATPDLMPMVGKLGRTLGPRGLMPNPKTGTVTTEVGKAVGEFKGGKVEYRTDRYGNVHVPIGKVSFTPEALTDNLRAVLDELQRAKPASSKGRYLKRITRRHDHGPERQGRPRTVCGDDDVARRRVACRPTTSSLAEDIRCAFGAGRLRGGSSPRTRLTSRDAIDGESPTPRRSRSSTRCGSRLRRPPTRPCSPSTAGLNVAAIAAAAPLAARGRRRLQDLQEHARALRRP